MGALPTPDCFPINAIQMRRNRPPRTPLQRFAIILLAVATVSLGYYLGNLYQFDKLRNSAAIMLDEPLELDTSALPERLQDRIASAQSWVVLLPGQNGNDCDRLLEHYMEVVNRLAAWPEVQERINLALLVTSDRPSRRIARRNRPADRL